MSQRCGQYLARFGGRAQVLGLLAIVCAVLSCPGIASAELTKEQRVEILNQAQRAYDRATSLRHTQPIEAAHGFREAAESFQLLVDDGSATGLANGNLYYNLGNAYFQAGRLGSAILNYRRAEKLIPRDGRLEHNLGVARSSRLDQIDVGAKRAILHTLFFWHYDFPIRWRYGLGITIYLLFWCALATRSIVRNFPWGYVLVPLLILWVSLGGSVLAEQSFESRRAEGVIIADQVIVRKGHGEGYEPQFEQPLHQGAEFTVVERVRDWLHIELSDGKTGWVRHSKAELI